MYVKIFFLIVISFVLTSCTGYSWVETWGHNGSNNWNSRKCNNYCATFEEDSNRCVEYTENAQPYCNAWLGH
jgi:hypothetical protein